MPEDHVGASWATELANISQQPVLRQVSRHKITQLAGLSDLCRSWGLLAAILNHVNIQGGRHLWSLWPNSSSQPVTQGCVQPSSEYLQGPPKPLWASLPASDHSDCEFIFTWHANGISLAMTLWPLPLSFHYDLLKILHFLYKLAWNKSLQLRKVLIFALNSQDTLGFPKFHVR